MTVYSLDIKPTDRPYKKILSRLQERIKMSERSVARRRDKWTRAEELVQAYVPESTDDARRRQRREQEGQPVYTTMSIPYSYAMLMTAHTYWTNVFLSRAPVHQFEGLHGEGEMNVQALETLIAYQVRVGHMLAPYYIWFYDAGKYGIGILGTYWDKEIRTYSSLEVGPDGKAQYITQQREGYEGNKAFNVSPFDFFPDPRVEVKNFQRGEFVGRLCRVSWAEVLRKKAANQYINVDQVKGSSRYVFSHEPREGHLERPEEVHEAGYTQTDDKHPAFIEVFEIFVELVPKEWGLGGNESPEKWVFTCTADFGILLSVCPFNAVHCQYPFDVLEPEVEAYGQWTRGIPETIEGVQNVIDWLVNSHFFNVRAIGDGRFIADPTRIDVNGLEEGTPGFVLRVKPAGMGQDIRTMFQQLEMRDPTNLHFNDVGNMVQMGERVFGISDPMSGVSQGGGRKTAAEVRTNTGFGTSRLKTNTEYMSASTFETHAEKLVMSSQQFYGAEKKMRIVGDRAQFTKEPFMIVRPEDIAGSFGMVPVDGSMPIDRFAQATLWKDLMGQLVRLPSVAMRYDIAKMVAWVANLAGMKNIDQFKIQVVDDAILAQQLDAGNVIAAGKSGGGGNADGVNGTGGIQPTPIGGIG